MLFHDYLEMLLGSKVKIRVLRTLWKYRGKEFTMRELAKFLGISHTGVKKVLDDLEKTNVIRARTLGKSYALKLSENSYTAGIAEKVFDMERRTLLELKAMIKERLTSPSITSAVLYGSILEGREMPRSDIDLLIVTKEREKVEVIVAGLQRKVSERFGNSISAYYISEEDLQKKRDEPPIKQALQNHALICGNPLGERYVGEG